MRSLAITLTALSLFAAPAVADTIHNDGPASSTRKVTGVKTAKAADAYAATVTPASAPYTGVRHGKSFYAGSPISGGQ